MPIVRIDSWSISLTNHKILVYLNIPTKSITCTKNYSNNLRDGMHSDFMTLSERFLNSGVVGVFVGNKVGGFDVATVWILTVSIEHFLV